MELKDVFEYMGFEKEPENIDQFKEAVKSNWTLKKEASKDDSIRNEVIGSTFKHTGQNIRKWLNENYSLEIPNSELDNKKLEDVVFDNVGKIVTNYETKIKDLEAQITTPNEALKDFETKNLNLEKRLKEAKDAQKAIETEYTQFKESKQNELKNYKIDVLKKDIFSKIKFSNDVTDVAKIGYNTLIESKYNIDFDEQGEAIIVDKKSGQRLPNEKVAGKYKTPFEVFEQEAISNKFVATNEHADKPKEKNSTFVGSQSPEPKQEFVNKVFFTGPTR